MWLVIPRDHAGPLQGRADRRAGARRLFSDSMHFCYHESDKSVSSVAPNLSNSMHCWSRSELAKRMPKRLQIT